MVASAVEMILGNGPVPGGADPRSKLPAGECLLYLTGGPPERAQRATRYLRAADELLLPDLMLAEVADVLESFYGTPRTQVAATLRAVLAFPASSLDIGAVHAHTSDPLGVIGRAAGRGDDMATIETSIQIDRALEDVYAYATDVGNMTQWLTAVVEAEQLSDGPLGVGTRIRAVGKMLGRRMDSVAEVTALEPNARFAFTVASGPFTSHNSYAFESVAGGTKVTDTVEIELGGVLGLANPLLGPMLRRQFEANLAALKDRVETQDAGGG